MSNVVLFKPRPVAEVEKPVEFDERTYLHLRLMEFETVFLEWEAKYPKFGPTLLKNYEALYRKWKTIIDSEGGL